jgi:condensation domain-containing protein
MNFVLAERVPVPFEGEGSGVGELTWTQRSIWADMQRAEISLAMTMVRTLGPEVTMESLIDEYRFYLNRFEAMRTLLRIEPDGRVMQVVHGAGTAEIKIYDAGERDPGEVAYEIEQHYGFGRFDYEHEFPMRFTLVRQNGVLTHGIMAISHHAADATAAMAMFEDRRDRDPVTGQPPRPPGIQPLAQAALQQTQSALRQNEAALRYWEEQLRVIPPSMFPTARPREDGYWYADFTSPAMYRGLRAIAAKLGVATGPVLYAAFATVLAQWSGFPTTAAMITVNNRFRPGFANAAGHMVQHGLCTLETAGVDFGELVLQARRRLRSAQKYGYYIQAELDALIERVGRERGVSFDLFLLYNDRRSEDSPLTTVEPEEPPGATTLNWRQVDHLHHRMIFHANDGPAGALAVQVQLDTAYISRAEVQALLQRMEQLVADALTRASC